MFDEWMNDMPIIISGESDLQKVKNKYKAIKKILKVAIKYDVNIEEIENDVYIIRF